MAARTLKTIYDEIISEKNTFSYLSELQPNIESYQTLLQSLTSKSRVGVWRLIFFVTAVAIWTHEKLLDIQTKEIEQRAVDVIPGAVKWYRDTALLFQDGDGLFWDGKKYTYSPIVEANRLVAYAAAIESNNQVIIKVAKDVAGVPTQLTAAEEARFEKYINLIKYAGTNTAIINQPADVVNIIAEVFYDPLLLDATGTLISDGVTKPIEAAIDGYFYDLGTVNFNGRLRLQDLIDAMQGATGYNNAVVSVLGATSPAVVNVLTQPGQTYQSIAGHMAVGVLTLTYTSI